MIKNIKIKNFRLFNEFEITNLKKINILTGNNDCGKTSFLEALFLISNINNTSFIKIQNLRNFLINNNEDFGTIFNKIDFNKEIILEFIKTDLIERKIIIKNQKNINSTINIENNYETDINQINNNIINIKNPSLSIYYYEENKEIDIENTIFKNSLIDIKFLTSRDASMNFTHMDDIFKNSNKLSEIIKIIKIIEPRIRDIRRIGGLIYVNIGLNEYIPINFLGNGFKKFLYIISNILTMTSGILLIDEIENGLHHSSFENLWEAILETIESKDIQLFISTHSDEAWKSLAKVCKDRNKKDEDDIQLIRIPSFEEREYGKINKAFSFNASIITAMEDNFEIR